MKRFRYRTKEGKELWLCEACKKTRSELILLGALTLIGRKDDLSVCEACGLPEKMEAVVS